MAKKKSFQLFTVDNAIVFLLLLSLIMLFQSFLFLWEKKLERDATILLDELTATKDTVVTVLQNKEVNTEKVESLANTDYNEIKKVLDVESEFCIYFEDVGGSIIQVSDYKKAIGSQKIVINGEPCT